MNKARRAELDKVLAILNVIDIGEALGILEEAEGEERDGFENLSEGLQASERGQAMEACDTLGSAQESLNEAVAKIEEARDGG